MKNCPRCEGTYPTNFMVCPQDGTPLVEVGAWSDGSVIRGKYRILNKVGQGGMGAVYKALHLAFDELRALKVMAPELLSDVLLVKRFKHEAVITRKLQHPNAVRVDDIDEAEDGRPFIVMEYIEGRSLKTLIREEGPLPVPRVCLLVKQVAAALDAAHRLGMVHRDIKPENIVLVETPEGEQAKVLDFGIAKVREARLGGTPAMTLTGTGVVIGTPQYMSPEQAMGKRGDELDGRSDLYSLGIVMYQMLTADLPFKADTTMEMLLAHLQKLPTPIRTLRPELQIPERIADLTMKLLEKDPDLRPVNARALFQQIESAEEELSPPGPTRAFRPTRVVPSRGTGPAPAATPAGSPGEAPTAPIAHTARPAGTAQPRPAAAAGAVVVVPPRTSRWSLWVGLAVLVLVLSAGGWYFTVRHTGSPSEAPSGAVSPPARRTPRTSQPAAPSRPTEVHRASERAAGRTTAGSPAESPTTAPGEKPSVGPTLVRRPASQTGRTRPAGVASRGVSAPAAGAATAPTPAGDARKIKTSLTLGDIYFKDGKYDEALGAYREGLVVDPSNAELRNRIERVKKAKAAEQRVLQ